MIGIGLCASSAATINQIIDRNIDANMARTSNRPLPQGEITTFNASLFAFALMIVGTAILVSQVNTLTAVLTVASLIGYAFIYTVFLKRATPQNIVIGGLAGAAPPLLGWTSVTNSIDPNALLLVLIIFVWTPPQVYTNVTSYSWSKIYKASNYFIYSFISACKFTSLHCINVRKHIFIFSTWIRTILFIFINKNVFNR